MSLLTLAEIRRTRPRATNWVTTDDIEGVGLDIVLSSFMTLNIASLPPIADIPMIEVQFTQTSVTDSVLSWLEVRSGNPFGGVEDNTAAGSWYTGMVPGGGPAGPNTRTLRIKPLILHHMSGESRTYSGWLQSDRLQVRVRSRGYLAETEWAVTNIRARLVYVPLTGEGS